MDRYKVVHKGYHGCRELAHEELDALYHEKQIRPHTPRYHWIDTLYALCEVTIYAAIVDALERRGETRRLRPALPRHPRVHRRGAPRRHHLRASSRAAFADFVDRDPDLARTLHKLRSAGKKLFLLTNSPWTYTERMMTYLLGGAMPEYPSWRHFFDVVICAAQKPRWFQEGRPLMERDGDVLTPRPRLARARQGLRGRQPRTSSSACSAYGRRACSTSAITSTATSCARRRKRPGARR